MKNKIILGTVKFGLPDYGFSSGQSRLSSLGMLNLAWSLGIEILDTSPRYGEAERCIGEYHKNNEMRFSVCTKVDNLRANASVSGNQIYRSLLASVESMNVDVVDTLYLHQNDIQIISDKAIIKALCQLKGDGLVKKIGVSVYSAEECEFALNGDIYDVVQLPVSILDSHIFSQIAEHGRNKEIVARSLFLQGVLFNRGQIRAQISQAEEVFTSLFKIDELVKANQFDLLSVACAFVTGLPQVDHILVGTMCGDHLSNIVKAAEIKLPELLRHDLMSNSRSYKSWGNPRNWKVPTS